MFVRSGTSWSQEAYLKASNTGADDEFGKAVAVSGETAGVGADPTGSAAGAAYVFRRDQGGADSWGEVTKLTASDAQSFDSFGWTVAISGDSAVVGAYREDAGGNAAGAAYVFDLLQPKATPTPGTPTDTPTPMVTPTPLPTPSLELDVISIAFATEKKCYTVRATVRNTGAAPWTGTVTLSEAQTDYLGFDGAPRAAPTDEMRDCVNGVTTSAGGSIVSPEFTLPPGALTFVNFQVAHDWEWIEAPDPVRDAAEILLEALGAVTGGANGLLLHVLNQVIALDSAVELLLNTMDATPHAEYRYTASAGGVTSSLSGIHQVEVNPSKVGALRGSATATIWSQISCPFSKNLFGFFACAFSLGTKIGTYYAAWDPDPNYTELAQPVFQAPNATGLTPDETQYAQHLLDAQSYDEAAKISLFRAAGAEEAGEDVWENAQLVHAESLFQSARTKLSSAVSLGSTFSPPDITEQEAIDIRLELGTTGFSAEEILILTQFGLTATDMDDIASALSTADLSLGRTFDQVQDGTTAEDEALGDLAVELSDAQALALDHDEDGCTNAQETGLDEKLGGLRDPYSAWDFYDVLGGGGGPPDGIIDLSNDIFEVIQHYAPTGNEPEYDVAFDRGPTAGPNAWNMTAPDGVIDLTNDILGVILQYFHSCQ